MSEQWFYIVARDKPGLLIAMMKELVGESHISFEGDLTGMDWSGLDFVAESESCLERQTSMPKLDLVIFALTEKTLPIIWQALRTPDNLAGGAIVHVQIAKHCRLAFSAYDNFHPDCVGASGAVPLTVLESLHNSGVIRSYREAPQT
jgi:hypothetical protein